MLTQTLQQGDTSCLHGSNPQCLLCQNPCLLWVDSPEASHLLFRFAALLRLGAAENASDCFPRVYAALEPKSVPLASFLTAQRAVQEANQVSQEDADVSDHP